MTDEDIYLLLPLFFKSLPEKHRPSVTRTQSSPTSITITFVLGFLHFGVSFSNVIDFTFRHWRKLRKVFLVSSEMEEEVVVVAEKWRSALTLFGQTINEVVSFVVFCLLDLVDAVLCFAFKVADYVMEAEWPPCYCSSSKEVITGSGNIVVSEKGEYSKIVCLTSSKLQLEEVSDTLYDRPSLVSEFSWWSVKRLNVEWLPAGKVARRKLSSVRSSFTINSTIVEMLQRRMVGKPPSRPLPRWSDCDCRHCTSWTYRGKRTLFVRAAGTKGQSSEDVLFIHGFISSSAFWTETLFPNFSDSVKSKYRFLAVDLLGFGRSPKPSESLYTLREHLDMIEQSVIEPFGVKSFHIVAHSLGCILALVLAVKHPDAVKSLTLLAPPYYPIPKGTQPTQYVMRRLAPRRVWPIITFGASLACWYEHITRAACFVFSRHHNFWEQLTKRVTRNRIRTFLLDGFFCHTHKSVWHTLHNVICVGAGKLDSYLTAVNDHLRCDVTVFHGKDDELIPVECSYNVQRRIPRANVKVIENKDHITIVVGRQKTFARDLEEIWRKAE